MSVVAPEDHEVERTDWRERRRAQKAEALAAVRRQIADGSLVVRQASPDEAERFGIKAYQERLAREREEAEAEQARMRSDKARRAAAARRHAPDPETIERLRLAREKELEAPSALTGVMVGVADAQALTFAEVGQLIGMGASGAQDRVQRARRAGVTGVPITNAEAQLRAGHDGVGTARTESAAEMCAAADSGMSWSAIGRAVGLTGDRVRDRVRALRGETDR